MRFSCIHFRQKGVECRLQSIEVDDILQWLHSLCNEFKYPNSRQNRFSFYFFFAFFRWTFNLMIKSTQEAGNKTKSDWRSPVAIKRIHLPASICNKYYKSLNKSDQSLRITTNSQRLLIKEEKLPKLKTKKCKVYVEWKCAYNFEFHYLLSSALSSCKQ